MTDYENFDIIWNEMSLEEKNVIVSSYLKTLPKWDLKRIMCDVLQVDSYMDDEQLSRLCNDERLMRQEVPEILGKSYRECVEDGDFDRIDKLPRVGIYSKISALMKKKD